MAGRHILVVDDDPLFAEATGELFRSAGFQVSVATHFNPALEILEAQPPVALLITDLVMPSSINGIALGRMARIRQPDIQVVYVTAFDIPRAKELALGPILRKPIDDAVLIEKAVEVLASNSPD